MTLTRLAHAPPTPRGAVRTSRVAGWELAAVGVAMATVALVGAVAITRDAPLLWDEAVYSLRVRDLVGGGVRGHYWIDVRAPGLPLLLAPAGALWGVGDATLRAACLVLAVGGVGLTWLTARLLIGPAEAVTAAWLLAVAPGWNESSWQVMPDIPGITLSLAAMAVVLVAGRGERLSWWALLAAPLAGAATLVRYGAPLLVVPAVVAAVLLRWPAARRAPGRAVAVIALPALAAAAVWFVPPVTGSPVAPVLLFGSRQDAKAIPGSESALDFWHSLQAVVGPLLAVLLIIGGVLAVVAAVRHPARRPVVAASGLIAVSVLLSLLVGIAQYHPRYLAPALPFLALLASVGLVHGASRTGRRIALPTAVALAVVGAGIGAATALQRADAMERLDAGSRAARLRVAERVEPPCVLWDRSPATEWYSGCAALRPADLPDAIAHLARAGVAADEPMFVVLRDGRRHQLRGRAGLVDDIALRREPITPTLTLLDVGTYGRFIESLRERGALAAP